MRGGKRGAVMEKMRETIIRLLKEDARYTPRQIAKMTSFPEADVAAEIGAMEREGVIVKYAAVVNLEKAAEDSVQALIELKVAPQKLKGFDAVASELAACPEVSSLYLMSGGFDLAVFLEARSLSEIARFVSEKLSAIDGVIGTAPHFILKKYKIEGQNTAGAEPSGRLPVHA